MGCPNQRLMAEGELQTQLKKTEKLLLVDQRHRRKLREDIIVATDLWQRRNHQWQL